MTNAPTDTQPLSLPSLTPLIGLFTAAVLASALPGVCVEWSGGEHAAQAVVRVRRLRDGARGERGYIFGTMQMSARDPDFHTMLIAQTLIDELRAFCMA
jgi:hypothetical protein